MRGLADYGLTVCFVVVRYESSPDIRRRLSSVTGVVRSRLISIVRLQTIDGLKISVLFCKFQRVSPLKVDLILNNSATAADMTNDLLAYLRFSAKTRSRYEYFDNAVVRFLQKRREFFAQGDLYDVQQGRHLKLNRELVV